MRLAGRRLASLARQLPPLRTSHLRSATATVGARPRVPAAAAALALLSLAAASASGSVALAAPLKKMESADAVRAEELYNDNSYDRRTLLADLRKMHAGAHHHRNYICTHWRLT